MRGSDLDIKRLCIYFFYDKFGIVDRYVIRMLSAMRPHCGELLFVSNGSLSGGCADEISRYADHIIERENKGFDVWAYKTALEHYGWDRLAEFDEVIMMNHTIMGPVYPLDEMFGKMDKAAELDFWGLTTYHGAEYDPYGKCRYKYLPLHIQSHFIAVRNRLLTSNEFREYWERMPDVHSYDEAVCFHEAVFTKHFEDLGFKWAAYVDTSDMYDHDNCPIIFAPVKIIKEKRCPVFKRRSFFHRYDDLYRYSLGDQGRQLLEYLESEKLYDTELIWENILRTNSMSDIMRCLCLHKTLSDTAGPKQDRASVRTALILHLYYEDQFGLFYNYALSMPESADIYITVSSPEKQEKLQALFSKGPWNRVEVRLIENRGRDVSALLVGCADVPARYDLVCFAHDKRSHKGEYGIMGEAFLEHCCKNILSSRGYVENVIELFMQQKRLGMLFAPPPCFGAYLHTIGSEWSVNVKGTSELADRLGLTVPIDFKQEPVAPLGTMFWFRSAALEGLFSFGWKYEDFPPEPNALDGTILHAVERIYPYAAQQAGYYPLWCEEQKYAQRYTLDLYSILRAERAEREDEPLSRIVRMRVKRRLKEKTPKKLWNAVKKLYHSVGGRKWIG